MYLGRASFGKHHTRRLFAMECKFLKQGSDLFLFQKKKKKRMKCTSQPPFQRERCRWWDRKNKVLVCDNVVVGSLLSVVAEHDANTPEKSHRNDLSLHNNSMTNWTKTHSLEFNLQPLPLGHSFKSMAQCQWDVCTLTPNGSGKGGGGSGGGSVL